MAKNYPQELYRFNLQRGMDPDNLIRFEDVLDLKSKYPDLLSKKLDNFLAPVSFTSYLNLKFALKLFKDSAWGLQDNGS